MKRSIVFGILLACFVAMSAGAQTETREELMARHVADEAGMTRGVCVVLGAGDGSFPEAMVRCTSFFVHVLDPDGARVALARERVDKDEQYLRRVAVDREAFSRLPHIDNMADLVVATDLTASTVAALPPAAEVLRVLRPRGKAILVGRAGSIAQTPRSIGDLAGGRRRRGVQSPEEPLRVAGGSNETRAGRRGQLESLGARPGQ